MAQEETLMSKQLRNIVITLAVVLLLLGGLLLLKLMPAQTPENEGEDTTTTTAAEVETTEGEQVTEPVTEPIDPAIYLTKDEEGNLDRIEIDNEHGKYTVVQPQKNMWMVEGYDDLMISDNVGFLVDSSANFKMASVVKEECDNLAEYGLDKPIATARIFFRDGSDMEVCFGDSDPASLAKSRYVYVKGGKTVYLESVGLSGAFTKSLEDMFSTEILSPQRITNDDGSVSFVKVKNIELGGKARPQPIKIERNKDYNLKSIGNKVIAEAELIVTAPIKAPLDISGESARFGSIYSRILEAGIEASSVVKVYPSEVDLAKYGLNEPEYTIKITSDEDKTYLFYVGKYDHENGLYYVADEFRKIVFAINQNHGVWMTATLEELVPKKLYDGLATELTKVTVKTPEGTNTFNITCNSDYSLVVKNGAKDVDEGAFRNFYNKLCEIEWIDAAQTIPTIGGKDTLIEVTVSYSGDAKFNSDVITLTKSSPRRYMIAINGKGYFACDNSTLNRLLDAYGYLVG